MGTIKIIGFDEQGQAQRLKIRIARILDYDPVTSAEKENIRETLGVDDSLGGTFTTPLSVTSASDSSFTGGGKVGIGTSSPSYDLHVTNASTAASIGITGTGGSKDTWTVTSSDSGGKALLNFTDEDTSNTVMRLHQDGLVGIGSAPAINLGNGLSVDGGSGYVNLNLVKGSSGTGHAVDFSDENGALQFRVGTNFSSGGNNLIFARGTGSTIAWKIDSATGNLVANSTGIDFGSGGASSLLDDYERGTTAPTDASGAGLTLAGVGCNYVKIGSQVTAWVTVTYPTTSDTSTARIGNLPFAIGSSDIDRIGGFVASQDTGLSVSVLGTTGTGQVTFRKTSGAPYANSELSGKFIWFCFIYDVS